MENKVRRITRRTRFITSHSLTNHFTYTLLFFSVVSWLLSVCWWFCVILLFSLFLRAYIICSFYMLAMQQKQLLRRDRASRLPGLTLSSSDWSFSASSSVSSWILGPSSFFFFLSASASLAALSFFSFSAFICFSLLAFCASLLWCAKASLIS